MSLGLNELVVGLSVCAAIVFNPDSPLHLQAVSIGRSAYLNHRLIDTQLRSAGLKRMGRKGIPFCASCEVLLFSSFVVCHFVKEGEKGKRTEDLIPCRTPSAQMHNSIRSALGHTSSAGYLETFRSIFAVALLLVHSHSWDAILSVPNDPRYS
ncbi:hypothetical protein TNCV_104521 [Trichonephila clavipes]|nr:hypothetical protein TNCV_104521 [Trichonephila clavipes]